MQDRWVSSASPIAGRFRDGQVPKPGSLALLLLRIGLRFASKRLVDGFRRAFAVMPPYIEVAVEAILPVASIVCIFAIEFAHLAPAISRITVRIASASALSASEGNIRARSCGGSAGASVLPDRKLWVHRMRSHGAWIDAVEARTGEPRIPAGRVRPGTSEQAGRRIARTVRGKGRIEGRPGAIVPIIVSPTKQAIQLLFDPVKEALSVFGTRFVGLWFFNIGISSRVLLDRHSGRDAIPFTRLRELFDRLSRELEIDDPRVRSDRADPVEQFAPMTAHFRSKLDQIDLSLLPCLRAWRKRTRSSSSI